VATRDLPPSKSPVRGRDCMPMAQDSLFLTNLLAVGTSTPRLHYEEGEFPHPY